MSYHINQGTLASLIQATPAERAMQVPSRDGMTNEDPDKSAELLLHPPATSAARVKIPTPADRHHRLRTTNPS